MLFSTPVMPPTASSHASPTHGCRLNKVAQAVSLKSTSENARFCKLHLWCEKCLMISGQIYAVAALLLGHSRKQRGTAGWTGEGTHLGLHCSGKHLFRAANISSFSCLWF